MCWLNSYLRLSFTPKLDLVAHSLSVPIGGISRRSETTFNVSLTASQSFVPKIDVQRYRVQDFQTRQRYGNFYYTHIHHGHHEALDQMMVSQAFVAEHPGRVGNVESVSVFNDHLVDETLTNDGIEPWQSDHGQVVASLKLTG